jgi:hypothetical protein
MSSPSSGLKNKPSKKPALAGNKQSQASYCFMLVSCLVYSLTLKMQGTCSPQTSDDFRWTTQRHTPEDKILPTILII